MSAIHPSLKGGVLLLFMIELIFNPNKKTSIRWKIKEETLNIINWDYDESNQIKATPITYFEPDFSDYKKLLNKIKTYITFS